MKLHSVSYLVLVLQLKFILKVHADDGKAKVVSKEKSRHTLKVQSRCNKGRGQRSSNTVAVDRQKWEVAAIYIVERPTVQ